MNEQAITFAAICQIATAVQTIARQGSLPDDELAFILKGVINTSPTNTLDVYGGEIANLRPGLQVMVNHLGDHNSAKDPELTRYIVSLLALERKLTKNSKQMQALGQRIEDSKRQLEHFELTSENLLRSFAGIYSDLISPLGTPIQVAGDPAILKQEINQYKIRSLLLAGIRSAVLWRQVGGKRRNILFARSKLIAAAQNLLNT